MLSFVSRAVLLSKHVPRVIYPVQRAALTIPTVAPTVDKKDRCIVVNWSSEKSEWSKYHFPWLRDNCQCSLCRDSNFSQRLLNTLEDATPADVRIPDDESGSVEVEWADGHCSQFSYDWLLTNSYCHNKVLTPKRTREVTLWDSSIKDNPPKMKYGDIMQDDNQSLLALLRNLYQYGFTLVEDTPPRPETMEAVGKRIGAISNNFFGALWFMEAGNMTVTHMSYGEKKIAPHNDMMGFNDTPGLFFFHVYELEGEGTDSLLIDSFRLASEVKKHNMEYFDLLSKVSLTYTNKYSETRDGVLHNGIYEEYPTTFTVDRNGEVVKIRLSQADRKPMDSIALAQAMKVLSCDADEAMDKMYKALRYLHSLIYDPKYMYKFRLKPGTLMLCDNHRLLHGRDEFTKGMGRRKACGLYVSQDEWHAKMKLLESELLD